MAATGRRPEVWAGRIVTLLACGTLAVLLSAGAPPAADDGGAVKCAQNVGQPLLPCAFEVARDEPGTALVMVTRPDGRRRALSFRRGAFVAAEIHMSDGPVTFSGTLRDAHFVIEVGDERYEIHEAVIFAD